MAQIKKDLVTTLFPLQYDRQFIGALDKTSIWYDLTALQQYAQDTNTSVKGAYVGQIVVYVDEANKTAQAFIIANVEGELVEVGSGSGAAMIFVDTVAGLTTLGTPPSGVPNDLEIGQQAFVSEDKKIYFLTTLGSTAPTSYVWESQASDAPVWSVMGSTGSSIEGKKVEFEYVHVMSDEYNPSTYNEEGKVYFITITDSASGGLYEKTIDSNHILFDGYDYNSSIVNMMGRPLSETAISEYVEGTLYVYKDSDMAYPGLVIKDGNNLVELVPEVITENGSDVSGVPTLDKVLSVIDSAINNIVQTLNYTSETGTISLGSDSTNKKDVVLTNVVHSPTYDSATLKLTIPVFGGDDVVVNIPKDKFVTSGKYYETYPENPTEGETVYNKVIVLTIDNQVEPVIIPAEALVNTLTANNTGNSVAISITSSEISANVVIDPASGSALTNTANGLKLDLSGKLSKLENATGNKIVITNEDGTIDESAFTVQTAGTLSTMTASDVPVATVIASAINVLQTSINNAKLDKLEGTAADAGKIVVVGEDGTTLNIGSFSVTSLETALNNKIDKVTDGVENDITILTADGAIKDSGVKIGGSALAEVPSQNTVATEAAVAEAFKWQQI